YRDEPGDDVRTAGATVALIAEAADAELGDARNQVIWECRTIPIVIDDGLDALARERSHGGDELLIGGIERRGDVVEIARDRGGTRLAGAFGTRRRAGADHARHVGPPGVEGNLRRAARCAGSGTEDTMGVYDYPLLIKNLLLGSTRQPTRNRIQYRDNPGY